MAFDVYEPVTLNVWPFCPFCNGEQILTITVPFFKFLHFPDSICIPIQIRNSITPTEIIPHFRVLSEKCNKFAHIKNNVNNKQLQFNFLIVILA